MKLNQLVKFLLTISCHLAMVSRENDSHKSLQDTGTGYNNSLNKISFFGFVCPHKIKKRNTVTLLTDSSLPALFA